jgi:hypothetical protein
MIERKEHQKPRYPNKYLVIGVLICIAGVFTLLWTLGFLPSLTVLWPFVFILLGLFFLYMVYFRGKNPIYIIFGMILFLLGIFFLLIITIVSEQGLTKIWPGFMLIAGVSLIPYAYKLKKRRAQVAITIPALSLVMLSIFFFIFSLNIMNASLSEFVTRWWPVLIIILGGSFIVVYLFSKKPQK